MPQHIPVLLEPILEHLLPAEHIIDGTLGAGEHSRAFLESGVTEILGLDLDPQALAIARETLNPFGERAHIVHASYSDMQTEATRLGWDGVDAILLDLGVSSMQFDTPERGFSFRSDAPLDMRFDPTSGKPTAADFINNMDADALADIFYEYGEERQSRKIARALVANRPFETTQQLAAAIEKVIPRKHNDKIHPATRVFQALRIAVNEELETVKRALPIAIDLLNPGGRFAVISFHSLEDRIVKEAFRLASTDCICPPNVPVCVCGHVASVERITRKPITATEAEIAQNPRSRSAKLRIVEKLDKEIQHRETERQRNRESD